MVEWHPFWKSLLLSWIKSPFRTWTPLNDLWHHLLGKFFIAAQKMENSRAKPRKVLFFSLQIMRQQGVTNENLQTFLIKFCSSLAMFGLVCRKIMALGFKVDRNATSIKFSNDLKRKFEPKNAFGLRYAYILDRYILTKMSFSVSISQLF